MKRPIEITLFAVFSIVYAVFKLAVWAYLLVDDSAKQTFVSLSSTAGALSTSDYLQVAASVSGSLLLIVFSVYLIKGAHWARLAIIALCGGFLVISLVQSGLQVYGMVKIAGFAAVCLILLSSRANRYFARDSAL